MDNEGYWLIHEGEAQGTIIGGNLSTLCLLCGTSYFPDLNQSILFLEDDFESHSGIFERQLQQLMMQSDFAQVRAIVFGRFQKASKIGFAQLKKIIESKPKLKNIPIIANADFGHTMPFFTFPIGGHAKLFARADKIRLFIN